MSTTKPLQVTFLKLANGTKPGAAWIRTLDVAAKATVVSRIARMQEGNFGKHRMITGDLGELKVDLGPGYRVYFGRKGMLVVIVLTGGDKGSQSSDIPEAERLWEEWKRANR